MILAIDGGMRTFGYAVVQERTGRVVELGELYQESLEHLDDSTDHATRSRRQSRLLLDVSSRHDITAIAAEAKSLGGPPQARLWMATALSMCWGMLGMLAEVMHVDLYEVPPKTWQRAIVPGSGSSIDYDEVFARLSAFITGAPLAQLLAIPKGRRNHPLDAVGVGLYAALTPKLTVIGTEARA